MENVEACNSRTEEALKTTVETLEDIKKELLEDLKMNEKIADSKMDKGKDLEDDDSPEISQVMGAHGGKHISRRATVFYCTINVLTLSDVPSSSRFIVPSTTVAHLISLSDPTSGITYPIGIGLRGSVSIGRSKSSCQIVLEEPSVSRIHAEISAEADDLVTLRIMSQKENWVGINGERVKGSKHERSAVNLLHKDVLSVGKTDFRIEYLKVTDAIRQPKKVGLYKDEAVGGKKVGKIPVPVMIFGLG